MDEPGYIMALDQGTSSTRAGLIDIYGSLVSSTQIPFKQSFPREGWVEQDPWDIFNSTLEALTLLLEKSQVNPSNIHSIGITNQRETTILWDSRSGEPIYNAIGWQCRRTTNLCQTLIEAGMASHIKEITGLPIDPEFSATKIAWILDHVPEGRRRATQGDIKFGTVDSWIIWNLTHRSIHVTDVTNASRTMLYDINNLEWADEMLDLFDIPRAMLPEIVPSDSAVGNIHPDYISGDPKKIIGVMGDQQAALFGQACFQPGMTKCTYGTGAFMLMNTGNRVRSGDEGLIETIGWLLDDNVVYALEGAVLSAGATVNWAITSLGLGQDVLELQTLAESVPDSNGVVIVPAFAGLGSPYWDSKARASIQGISFSTEKAHLARSIIESTAYQCSDMLEAFVKSSHISVNDLRVDGGGAANDLLMQHQADLLGTKVHRARNLESTMIGVAHLSGLNVGFWKDLEELGNLWDEDIGFLPEMKQKQRHKLKNRWKKAVIRSRNWI